MIRIIIVKQIKFGMKRKQNDDDDDMIVDKKYVCYIHTYIYNSSSARTDHRIAGNVNN